MDNNGMKPVLPKDSPKYQPAGNMENKGASFGAMRSALDNAQKNFMGSSYPSYPGFKPGFDCLPNPDWQATTIGTKK